MDPWFYAWSMAGAIGLLFRFSAQGLLLPNIFVVIKKEWADAPWAIITNAVLFVGFGGVLATAMLQPATVPQAVGAGLGWTGLVGMGSTRREI